jgi:hypothetical protein
MFKAFSRTVQDRAIRRAPILEVALTPGPAPDAAGRPGGSA